MSLELIKVLSDLQALIEAWQTKEIAVEAEFTPKLAALSAVLAKQVEASKQEDTKPE